MCTPPYLVLENPELFEEICGGGIALVSQDCRGDKTLQHEGGEAAGVGVDDFALSD